jgi:hypothetical protein
MREPYWTSRDGALSIYQGDCAGLTLAARRGIIQAACRRSSVFFMPISPSINKHCILDRCGNLVDGLLFCTKESCDNE